MKETNPKGLVWVLVVLGVLTVVTVVTVVMIWPKSGTAPAAPNNPNANNRAARREALVEAVTTGQEVRKTENAITIDLKPYINCQLDDPVASPDSMAGNNLAELPRGVNFYDGIPFDVSGVIQVYSEGLAKAGKTLPKEVTGIKVEHKFARLDILHGGGGVGPDNFGSVVAKLVLHYEDGSQKEFDVISGQHLLNWTGQFMQPNTPKAQQSGSRVAWVGSNPFIKASNRPKNAAHLWRTTFMNDKPDVAVTSIDYVSGLSAPTPFLVGMTVE